MRKIKTIGADVGCVDTFNPDDLNNCGLLVPLRSRWVRIYACYAHTLEVLDYYETHIKGPHRHTQGVWRSADKTLEQYETDVRAELAANAGMRAKAISEIGLALGRAKLLMLVRQRARVTSSCRIGALPVDACMEILAVTNVLSTSL